MKHKKYYIIALAMALLLICFDAIIFMPPKYLPNKLLRIHSTYKHFEKINPLYLETNVASLISIKSENDIIEKRRELIKHIWNSANLPDKMPDTVHSNIIDSKYFDLKNLKKIDKIIVDMDYGMNSIIYHFQPNESNNKLVIYHQGHEGNFVKGKKTIEFFLKNGYAVMAFSMPLLGMNSRPIVEIHPFGKIKLTTHDHLKFLKSDELNPIKFFLEPITVALNYAEELNYEDTVMTGISGGGWTTVLYSAIDPRISKSFPVAGSLPIFLRAGENEWGDYEQTLPELYQTANYLELYILGSYGNERRQLQIFNKYDSCCFAGVKYQVYEKNIEKIISRLKKGGFKVYLDDTHNDHKISNNALNVIINSLENKK